MNLVKTLLFISEGDMSKLYMTNKVLGILCLSCTKDPRASWWTYFTMKAWSQAGFVKQLKNVLSVSFGKFKKHSFFFHSLSKSRWSGSLLFCIYFITVTLCYYHVMYGFQSESALYNWVFQRKGISGYRHFEENTGKHIQLRKTLHI